MAEFLAYADKAYYYDRDDGEEHKALAEEKLEVVMHIFHICGGRSLFHTPIHLELSVFVFTDPGQVVRVVEREREQVKDKSQWCCAACES